LLAITTDLALVLEQLAWALWKQVAPKSTIRKESELSKLAGSYLAGDAEISTAQLTSRSKRPGDSSPDFWVRLAAPGLLMRRNM
jgi:hypothetical protein